MGDARSLFARGWLFVSAGVRGLGHQQFKQICWNTVICARGRKQQSTAQAAFFGSGAVQVMVRSQA